jgi:hypothetical protein
MNPDVFITIAFVGIAFMVPLVFLVFVVPQIRRENAGVQRRESRRQRESAAAKRSAPTPSSLR